MKKNKKEKLIKKLISSKWAKLSKTLFGNKTGKNCLWCKHVRLGVGIAMCDKLSQRKRISDKLCEHFGIDQHYCDDVNYESYVEMNK